MKEQYLNKINNLNHEINKSKDKINFYQTKINNYENEIVFLKKQIDIEKYITQYVIKQCNNLKFKWQMHFKLIKKIIEKIYKGKQNKLNKLKQNVKNTIQKYEYGIEIIKKNLINQHKVN